MSKLLEMLKEKKLTMIVQLPENNLEMAKCAEAAGADAVVICSGDGQDEILKELKIPVGVDLSSENKLAENKVKAHDKFDFINFHFEALPNVAKRVKPGKVIALNADFTLDKILGIENTKADAIDAAIIPLTQNAKELIVGDLQNYIAIAISSGLPVIVPTQRAIKPSEVAIISDTGAKGIILTPIVLGDDVKSIEKTIKEFRMAVDDLG